MIRIDLITGFLGAGKTTFIKKYADYLMRNHQRIAILENDFGAVNVDMLLLQDIAGDNCELEMIAGGCDKDCHYRRMKTKLISMGMRGFDRVLIEPSGIFEVDEFFDILHEEPLDNWYEIGNVITIADAKLPKNLSRESEYLLASQAANAGKIILSRAQEASDEELAAVVDYLNQVLEQFHCRRRLKDEILCRNWDELTDEDFGDIVSCGYTTESCGKLWFEQKDAFQSLYFMNMRMSGQELRARAEGLMGNTKYGNIFRIKGFMQVAEQQWVELNATQEAITIKPIPTGQDVLIVIGEHLNQELIERYWSE
ncbi:MAG: GTP-binding protein [Lachnospiraceae bacterium]|nr:GTP-binding protein [Lachnospiraceae bacterium]MBO5144910.1 GTP-binding protein [Lachnospiraceae bacterium]